MLPGSTLWPGMLLPVLPGLPGLPGVLQTEPTKEPGVPGELMKPSTVAVDNKGSTSFSKCSMVHSFSWYLMFLFVSRHKWSRGEVAVRVHTSSMFAGGNCIFFNVNRKCRHKFRNPVTSKVPVCLEIASKVLLLSAFGDRLEFQWE